MSSSWSQINVALTLPLKIRMAWNRKFSENTRARGHCTHVNIGSAYYPARRIAAVPALGAVTVGSWPKMKRLALLNCNPQERFPPIGWGGLTLDPPSHACDVAAAKAANYVIGKRGAEGASCFGLAKMAQLCGPFSQPKPAIAFWWSTLVQSGSHCFRRISKEYS